MAAAAAVVRQLGLAIEVEVRRLAETAKTGGRLVSSRSLREESVERASFVHGELIEIVDAFTDTGGRSFALACLDRERAAGRVLEESERTLMRFGAASARADDAWARGDAGEFALAYREAAAALPAEGMWEALAQARVLLGHPSSLEQQIDRSLRDLERRAASERSRLEIRLSVVRGDEQALVERTRSALHEAIATLGLRAIDVEQPCPGGGGSLSKGEIAEDGPRGRRAEQRVSPAQGPPHGRRMLALEVRPELGCRWDSLGYLCRPRIVLMGSECEAETTSLHGELQPSRGRDRRSQELAAARALSGLQGEALLAPLRELLSSAVPLAPKTSSVPGP